METVEWKGFGDILTRGSFFCKAAVLLTARGPAIHSILSQISPRWLLKLHVILTTEYKPAVEAIREYSERRQVNEVGNCVFWMESCKREGIVERMNLIRMFKTG